MPSIQQLLETLLEKAGHQVDQAFITKPDIAARIKEVCEWTSNRAPTRFLMACLLAKMEQPKIDIRKPYTEIGTKDAFSGRTYDESYIQPFVFKYELPCNPTTAFLTPAFRNKNTVMTPELELEGRPRSVYKAALGVLNDVKKGSVSPEDVFLEILRLLILLKNEKRQRLESLLKEVKRSDEELPISAESIVTLLTQHLACKYSSRLPVLVVAAAYKTSEKYLGERVLNLHGHNAADEQTGALGDVEITLTNEEKVITSYEMKTRRVVKDDIDRAIQKILGKDIDNYIFITTEPIDPLVEEYAKTMYDKTGGTEFVILDCIGFIKHFLHFFHRVRIQFLEEYQALLLVEPDSAVGQPLKEAFLALRRAMQIQHHFSGN